jgi:hypothetical protein
MGGGLGMLESFAKNKYRLLDLYKASVSAHSVAVSDLSLTHGIVFQLEYERLAKLLDEARVETEMGSQALFEHTREHGC